MNTRFLYPMDYFFAAEGRVLPSVLTCQARDVPVPFHEILVHNSDMTPVLERIHASKIRIRKLKRIQQGDVYMRLVVLEREDTGMPVEFGAIAIHLKHFSLKVQSEILDERIPLGALLRSNTIQHRSHPDVYFRANCEAWMSAELQNPIGTTLYGRHNRLQCFDDQILAEVVEIVTPS